jgi:hypothetical protein
MRWSTPRRSTVFKGDIWSFTVEPYGYPVKPIKATASSMMTSAMGPEKTACGNPWVDPTSDSQSDGSQRHGLSIRWSVLTGRRVERLAIWQLYTFNVVLARARRGSCASRQGSRPRYVGSETEPDCMFSVKAGLRQAVISPSTRAPKGFNQRGMWICACSWPFSGGSDIPVRSQVRAVHRDKMLS